MILRDHAPDEVAVRVEDVDDHREARIDGVVGGLEARDGRPSE